MSQSIGWADCITLAMAPIGVITIIVSAIRVAGPRVLKAIIGRARENVATVELEIMSSTSPEACELWNSQTRAVVRCAGTTNNCELVCIYPKSIIGKKIDKSALRVQVMEIEKAVAQGDRESATNGSYNYLQRTGPNRDATEQPPLSIEEPTTIVITRNPKNIAPNMTLNCTADGDRWQVRICAVVGIIIQTCVLVFFVILAKHRKLKFDKDGSPVQNYAMPMAVLGTLAINVGILICAHVVDESSTEETYEVTNKDSAAIAMVWLQKEKTVSDQHFDSTVIYPTVTRHRACISKRKDGSEKTHSSLLAHKHPSNTLWLEFMTTTGALISVLGFFVQFIGLRGMHWLASIAQLAAVIIMTTLRAIIRRHLASGLTGHDLKALTGFELEWFITSLLKDDMISWVPGPSRTPTKDDGIKDLNADDDEQVELETSSFKWIVKTGDGEGVEKLSPVDETRETMNHDFEQVSDVTTPQSILYLRRHLGELSEWHGTTSKEALAVAQAIEKTMNFFMPFAVVDMDDDPIEKWVQTDVTLDDDASFSTVDSADVFGDELDMCSGQDSEFGNDDEAHGRKPRSLDWGFKVDYSYGQQGINQDNEHNRVRIRLKQSSRNGWSAPVDVIDAALSLWLFSTRGHRNRDNSYGRFPSGNDQWIRGDLIQEGRSLRIVGPSTQLLLRDLDWWMPNGLDGISEAHIKQSSDNKQDFLQSVQRERIGAAGERWYSSPANIVANRSLSKVSILDGDDGTTTHWRWQPAEKAVKEPNPSPKEYHDLDEESESDHDEPLEQTQRLPSQLIVESEDPLHVLQAKDLFSSFLWSMASFLGNSVVSHKLEAKVTARDSNVTNPWNNCSLQNHGLSHLVQSIARIGLWTEWEVWTSLIPPLSATDNLPGLEPLIQLVLAEGTQKEKAGEWEKAQTAYRWLFDISSLSLPESYFRAKSRAIVWKFCERAYNFNDYFGFMEDCEKPSYDLEILLIKDRKNQKEFYVRLENLANLHQRLEHLEHHLPQNLDLRLLWDPDFSLETGPVDYKGFKKHCDIFGRTYLHHNMQSSFIDHDYLKKDGDYSLPFGSGDLPLYRKRIARAVKAGRELKSDPMQLLDHLFWAIFFPSQTLKPILGHGADPNAQDVDGLTPLHYVCMAVRQNECIHEWGVGRYFAGRDEQRVQVLLDNKADINAQDLLGNSPLHQAAFSGREDLVKILIQHGCNVGLSNVRGETPLHVASKLDRRKILSLLLEAGAEIDTQDGRSQTPLHIAVAAQNEEVIKTLAEHGAKQDVLDRQHRTPFVLAASLGFLPIVELLYDDSGLSHGIIEAVKSNTVDVVNWLLEKATIDSWPPSDEDGTLFYHASARNRPELTAKLLQFERERSFGSGSVLVSETGVTALSIAISTGNLRVVEVLTADLEPEIWIKLLELTDMLGYTPLLKSVLYGRKEVFSYLVAHDANIRVRGNINGKNLLHVAAEGSSTDMMKAVIGMINKKEGYLYLCSMLETRDKYDRTPRDLAARHGLSNMLGFLDEELDKLRMVEDQVGKSRADDATGL